MSKVNTNDTFHYTNSYLKETKITYASKISFEEKHYLPNPSNELYYKKEISKYKRLYNSYVKQLENFHS